MMDKETWIPYKITPLVLAIIIITTLSFFLFACNRGKTHTAKDAFITVKGKIHKADTHTQAPSCPVPSENGQNGEISCFIPKTIELTFHRNNDKVKQLIVSTNLYTLSGNKSGWISDKKSLVCSEKSICKEECNLALTYFPTPQKPESTLYINYAYIVEGIKQPRHNHVSIVYSMP